MRWPEIGIAFLFDVAGLGTAAILAAKQPAKQKRLCRVFERLFITRCPHSLAFCKGFLINNAGVTVRVWLPLNLHYSNIETILQNPMDV